MINEVEKQLQLQYSSSSSSISSSSTPIIPTIRRVWGGMTMYGLNDLPFDIENLPDIYSNFRRKVEDKSTLKSPIDVSTISWKPLPRILSSLPASVTQTVEADPPIFPFAVNNIQAIGVNKGIGKIPSLETLGTADLRPLYEALGITSVPQEAVGIWSNSNADNTSSTGTKVTNTSSTSSNIPLYYETTQEVFAIPSHTDKRGVLAFQGGETQGLARLQHYLFESNSLQIYKETRNGLVGANYSSKFSPWLAFGCLSPRKIAAEVKRYEATVVANESTYWMLFELLWRDYFHFYALKYGSAIFRLYGPRGLGPLGITENKLSTNTNPATSNHSVSSDQNTKEWRMDNKLRNAWCLGATGYPFVDANMRELLSSGFMSNRGRQNVASFFVKDLELDWRFGGEWFESLLIDHDPASNYGNWTYVAGVGADPREDRYFLIPKQAKDYDPQGKYIRHWLPELSSAATEGLLDPSKLSDGIRFNSNYPAPVVRLMAQRRGYPMENKGKRKNNFVATPGSKANAESNSASAIHRSNNTNVSNESILSSSNTSSKNDNNNSTKEKVFTKPFSKSKKHSRVQHF